MFTRFRLVLGLAAAALLVAVSAAVASGGDDDTPDPPPVRDGPAIVWARPATVDLGGGWTVADAEGDGPFLAVSRDGTLVGFIEYGLDYEAAGTLDDHVADFAKVIGEDRAEVADYRFATDEPVHATAVDGPIVRYGFTGTWSDGSPSERTFNWVGVRDGRFVLVSAQANDPGGLFEPEGPAFTTAQLESVAGRLDALIRASGLPHPA